MHVIATAGHVDHGKTALVRALTGAEPDRLAEERRRGLTIELGYAWLRLPAVGEVALVDVPGHERFVRTMLAGVGAVPAALLVVAADDGWMPQTQEHLAALEALGVRHGVLAITRCDLADPGDAERQARRRLSGTGLQGVPTVPTSSVTGEGIEALRTVLGRMCAGVPAPDPDAPVRVWVDRCFTVRGAGTVATGTLPQGTVRRGTMLAIGAPGGNPVRVRALQALGSSRELVTGPARVALNLSAPVEQVGRSAVLADPRRWCWADQVDVRVLTGPADQGSAVAVPREPTLHVGSVHLPVDVRTLGEHHCRLRLPRSLPWHVGDRALLRDPGDRRVWGVVVLDPDPPPLTRRGASVRRGLELDPAPGEPGLDPRSAVDAAVRRHGVVAEEELRRQGLDPALGSAVVRASGWVLAAERARCAAETLHSMARSQQEADPRSAGVPVAEAAPAAGLPDPALVAALVGPEWRVLAGRLGPAEQVVPQSVAAAVRRLRLELAHAPFAAPSVPRAAELGLDPATLSAAARLGLVDRLAGGVVLVPGTVDAAAEQLRALPAPFTAGQARQALGTSRRVVLALLARLDEQGRTRRHPDDSRSLRVPPG